MIHAHKGFAYLILAFVAVFIVVLILAMFSNSGKITNALRKISKIGMMVFHTQFLIGLALLLLGDRFWAAINNGVLMSDKDTRVSLVEHPVSMLIAAVLLTIANKKIKTQERLSVPLFSIIVVALALFFSAFPFAKL